MTKGEIEKLCSRIGEARLAIKIKEKMTPMDNKIYEVLGDCADRLFNVENCEAEVVTGKWVKMTGMMIPELMGHYKCSNCEWHGSHHDNTKEIKFRFCPYCGARMINAE